jgi:hypothetical protein
MITIHAPNADDFSTLGLGALLPTEAVIEDEAGGMYELALSQPIADDGRHMLIQNGRIIKAPAPVRETPLVQIGQSGSVTRQIYKVQTSGARLRMRAKPSTSAKILGSYKVGTEVVRLEVSGSWAKVILKKGGATGWMYNSYLTFVRTESETIQGDKPGGVVAHLVCAQLKARGDHEHDFEIIARRQPPSRQTTRGAACLSAF